MLRGHVFSEQIFGVDIFALFINQFLGGNNGIIQSYKNAMAMTNTSNSIEVGTGVAVIQGRYVEEHTGSVINYSKADSLYCSLVIEIDLGKTNTQTSLEQVKYKVLEGENSYPTLTQEDIANQTGNIYQFELARFQNGPTGITNFTDRRSYLSFDSVYSGIIQDNLTSDSSTSALSARQGRILNEKITGTVLWENSNPGDASGFPGQTVTLNDNISNYRAMSIQFRGYYGSTYSLNTGILPPVNAIMVTSANIISRRLLSSITGTTATFEDGQSYETYNGTPSIVNLVCIPEKIIGYK